MEVKSFVSNYISEKDIENIEFKWNGKHAEEFEDFNQDFRFAVAEYIIENNCTDISLELVRDVFIAESEWAKEVWGTSKYFSLISECLLGKGDESIAKCFLEGFHKSFDTYACMHSITIEEHLAENYIKIFENLRMNETDEQLIKWLDSGKELMEKFIKGNASQGFVSLKPGTQIENVRVIHPLSAKIRFGIKKFINKFRG
ncbi:MAG: hypothetical protein ACOYWZ_01920 [Bacillota bacterium]